MDLRSVQDIEYLRQIALVQKTQIDHLLRVLSRKCQELEALKGDSGELQRTLELLNTLKAEREASTDADAQSAPEKRQRPRRPGHGPSAQPDLPRTPVTYQLEESERSCSACGGTLQAWEGQLERSEMIDVIDVEYRVVEVQRQKYVCHCGGCVKTAPGPERAIPGGRYSVDFAAKVVVDKYLDHRVPRRVAPMRQRRWCNPCCMEDEGRPLGIGVQAQVPNHLELLRLRVWVVSVEGNGAARLRPVRSKKTNASEPLMTCREVSARRRNREGVVGPG